MDLISAGARKLDGIEDGREDIAITDPECGSVSTTGRNEDNLVEVSDALESMSCSGFLQS
jgi:hypothetical protein